MFEAPSYSYLCSKVQILSTLPTSPPSPVRAVSTPEIENSNQELVEGSGWPQVEIMRPAKRYKDHNKCVFNNYYNPTNSNTPAEGQMPNFGINILRTPTCFSSSDTAGRLLTKLEMEMMAMF